MTEIIKTNNNSNFKVLIYGSDTNYIVVDIAYLSKGYILLKEFIYILKIIQLLKLKLI